MFVYFIRENQNVKIGITRNIETRLKQFRTGNANKLKLVGSFFAGKDAKRYEQALHFFFRGRRIGGEWFSLPDFFYDNETRTLVYGNGGIHLDSILEGGEHANQCGNRSLERGN